MSSIKTHLIVAMTQDQVIGKDNQMPWHISADLKLFKRITSGQTVIMGRKTFDSLGKPLPNRNNIVISSSMQPTEGITIARSINEALDAGLGFGTDIFFIGGATIYKEALLFVDNMHISWVKQSHTGDTLFPSFASEQWQIASSEEFEDFTYVHYKRLV